MKVLVTGASGLLGSEICRRLDADREFLGIKKLLKLRRKPGDHYLAVDLANPADWPQIAEQDWSVVIHTAAIKEPDKCENNQPDAVMLNVAATAFLANEAARRRAYMIYICTDYVFPGINPPYDEDAAPEPLNYYGQTKWQGELAVLAASTSFASLRVPILYGLAAGIEQSGAIIGSLRPLFDRHEQKMDDVIVRYPTWTGNVAAAVELILSNQAAGVFHCTAEERTTKYGLCVALAQLLDLPYDHLQPYTGLGTGAPRPHDAHLSWQRLRLLGFPGCKSFSQQLQLMKPELAAGIRCIKS